MTTLDPSHLPWLAGNADPGTGAAVHTSVRGVPAASPKPRTSARRQQHGQENAADPDEHDAIRQWQREHRKQRRRERDEARQANRIPTLPLPDVRFEQSYLLSIQPFIHARAPEAGPSSAASSATATTDVDADADADAADAQARNHASSSSRDKRRKLEESLALVADPAANHLPAKGAGKGKGKGNAMDALFETGSLVHIDWGQIAYLTVRDQILSPLVQGALWALGGIVYTSFRAYLRGAPALLDAGSRPTAKGAAGYRGSSGPSFLDRVLAPLKLRSPL